MKSSYVDKYNCRMRGEKNPRIHGKPTQPQRVIVWCALWSGGVIGPCFLENAASEAVAYNGYQYCRIIIEFLVIYEF